MLRWNNNIYHLSHSIDSKLVGGARYILESILELKRFAVHRPNITQRMRQLKSSVRRRATYALARIKVNVIDGHVFFYFINENYLTVSTIDHLRQ